MSTSMTLPVALPIPAAGSLQAYIQTAYRIPMLSVEEEQSLAREWRDHEDIDAARRLVLSHLRLVVSVARGYLGYGLPHADLIQEGNIGLMKAVKRYDPARGVRLVSFAIHWIRAEIHEYVLRNWRLVRVATTKAQRKLFFNLRSMKKGLAPLSNDEIDGIATELHVKGTDVREMEARLSGQEVAFDADDADAGYSPEHYLANPDAEPSRVLEDAQDTQLRAAGLQVALQKLDPRSRRIIEARWLKEKDTATLHDLAAEFGVSAERIRQIESKALEKMRGSMQAPGNALAAPAN